MKRLALLASVAFVAASCGGGGSSGTTIAFKWSEAGDIRGSARAEGIAKCLDLEDVDAATNCAEKYAEKKFKARSASKRAQVLKEQCAKPGVGKVKLTWEDFDGNTTTVTDDCP